MANNGYRDLLSGTMEHTVGSLLGTVEKYMTDDPDTTLKKKKIAEIGFKELEYPQTYGHPVGRFKSTIKKYGLVSLGGGKNITNLSKNFKQFADEYQQIKKRVCFLLLALV